MNNLSWLIYLGDVCGSIGFPAFFFALIGTIAAIGSTLVKHIAAIPPQADDDAAAEAVARGIQRAAIPMAIIGFLLCVFVPSKDTVYAIAASEMGEEVLKTPEAAKARQALNAWLDKQIGSQKPEK